MQAHKLEKMLDTFIEGHGEMSMRGVIKAAGRGHGSFQLLCRHLSRGMGGIMIMPFICYGVTHSHLIQALTLRNMTKRPIPTVTLEKSGLIFIMKMMKAMLMEMSVKEMTTKHRLQMFELIVNMILAVYLLVDVNGSGSNSRTAKTIVSLTAPANIEDNWCFLGRANIILPTDQKAECNVFTSRRTILVNFYGHENDKKRQTVTALVVRERGTDKFSQMKGLLSTVSPAMAKRIETRVAIPRQSINDRRLLASISSTDNAIDFR